MRIVLLELALILVFIGFTTLVGSILPINTTAHDTLLVPTLQRTFLHFGLYPWALIALFAAAFGISSYGKNQNTYLSDIVGKVEHKKFEILKVGVNLTGRGATMALISLALITATFLMASLLTTPNMLQNVTGFSVAAVGTSFTLLFFALRRKTNPVLNSLESQRPVFGILLNALIFAVLISLIAFVVNHLGTGNKQMPLFFNAILDKGWVLHWQLISTLYWLSAVPISAILITKFSHGYSLRAMLSATLLCPFIVALILLGIKFILPSLSLHLPHVVAVILGLIGFVLLSVFLFNTPQLPLTMQCYLPKPGHTKPRSKELFSTRWKKMFGLMCYLFIPAGIFVLAILLSLLILPMLLITTGVILYLLRAIKALPIQN
jgi:hypothetical protein